MTVLVILLLLALVFGLGAVIEGLLWMLLVVLALLAAAAWLAWSKFREVTGTR